MRIGGNIKARLLLKTTVQNEIGENVPSYKLYKELKGFLDLVNEATNLNTYNAKIKQSTNIFICDYTDVSVPEAELVLEYNCKHYEVMYIDNPMELNKHLEIYLKYTGD